jgi:hypothetical protein
MLSTAGPKNSIGAVCVCVMPSAMEGGDFTEMQGRRV